MTVDWKKKLLPNIPYLLFVYLFDKLCQEVRLAPGLDASEKFLHLSQDFTEAFSYAAPSLHPLDLLCRAQFSSTAAMIAFAPPMHTVSSSPPCIIVSAFFIAVAITGSYQPTKTLPHHVGIRFRTSASQMTVWSLTLPHCCC